MDITTILFLVAGLALLVLGADLLVRGAARIAIMAGISPLVIGLTIVAYGTSSPELAVSIQSSFAGEADIAVGNVIGSNLFNILMVLGLSSLVAPLPVARQLIRFDVPFMIGVSILTFILGRDGIISRFDGTILFIGGVGYTIYLIYKGLQDGNEESLDEFDLPSEAQSAPAFQTGIVNVGLILIGFVFLVLGAHWLTESAIAIARALQVSELVIGLTLVATGTSLPELASSLAASYQGERDIAVGNVIGSNIFNLLAVLALCAIVSPNGIIVSPVALQFDFPFMIAVAIACLPVFFSESRISRPEGLLFIGYYVAYALYLFLKATDGAQLAIYSQFMAIFVIPITVVVLIGTTIASARGNQRSQPHR
ncbi:MAG: calcium/sodium antiporter [Desertifilum sp. SIO1I2]|nr:calcium/sodium antiporter [Desertifilum sp. SIO1I2]